jgi:hypothetical protein
MPEDELARRRRLRSGEELRERLRASRERGEEREAAPLNLDPRSTYEVLTRQMVSDLADELREIRQRVNGLIFVTVTAVITDVVLRLTR